VHLGRNSEKAHLYILLYINKGFSLSFFYITYGLKTNFKMLLMEGFLGWDGWREKVRGE
jgi:hypothetical protein